ncbi:outer membrane protein assembly factor BamB [Methylotetracoccus oryzae]|uniref:outer membrane protein assembly factor BamB n=1 Tax=Methylotetracoccus oryzae TaxID=1919059 RepID=UPI00111AC540|nr:outer membrane protein assembly factor BamB [Methylotetracoccus oryzae]
MTRLALLLLSALLAGCAGLGALKEGFSGLTELFDTTEPVDPPVELAEITPTLSVRTLWDHDIGKGYDGQYVNLRPAVDSGRVFIADRRGYLVAYDRSTGNELWSTEVELTLTAGPAIGKTVLVVASNNGDVLAINPDSGEIAWRTSVSSEVLAFPQINRGRVLVRSNDGRIAALDEKTGTTLWSHERSVPPLSVRSRGAPVIAGDLVLDGYASGKLMALRFEDGKQEWEAVIAIPHGRSEIERLVDIDSTPVIKGDTAYVSGYQGGIASVGLSNGEVLWRRENLSTPTGLSADRRFLYLTDPVSDVWQLDVGNGGDLWKQTALHQRRLTAPVPVRNWLVVGDMEGYLHFLSKDDGSVAGRIQIDDTPIEAPPVVFDDVVYAYSSGGTLAAVSLD